MTHRHKCHKPKAVYLPAHTRSIVREKAPTSGCPHIEDIKRIVTGIIMCGLHRCEVRIRNAVCRCDKCNRYY